MQAPWGARGGHWGVLAAKGPTSLGGDWLPLEKYFRHGDGQIRTFGVDGSSGDDPGRSKF